MRSNVIKFIALLITATVVLISCTAGAESVGKLAVPGVAEIATEPVLSGARKIVSSADLPVPMTLNDAIERGHVERLREEETDLFSAIFLNEDGSKTMYMFASPIKYVSASGEVKDKRVDLERRDGGYVSEKNDVELQFGNASKNSVFMKANGSRLRIEPVTSKAANEKINLVDNSLIAENILGRGTRLEYKPLLSGLQQVISFESSADIVPYTFVISAEGIDLRFDAVGGYICNDKGDMIAQVCNCIAKTNSGVIEFEPAVKENPDGSITVTAAPSEDVLNNLDPGSPLVMAASVLSQITSSINDAVIYSGYPNTAFGSYLFNSVGYLDSSYKKGRLLVKTPGLFSNSTFSSISYSAIRKAELKLYTASNGQNSRFMPYRVANTLNWSESSVKWNDVEDVSAYMQLEGRTGWLQQAPAAGGSPVFINITGMVKAWKESTTYRASGIIIKNAQSESSSSYCRDFCSKEYANAYNNSLMPCLVVQYDTSNFVIINLDVKYDSGFVSRATDLYGSASNKISQRLYDLFSPGLNALQNRFGIVLMYSPQLASTYADSCPKHPTTCCNCRTLCYNSANGLYHHTNQEKMMSGFSTVNPSTKFLMVITGNKTCLHNASTGECRGFGNQGICYFGSNAAFPFPQTRIGIFNADQSSTANDNLVTKTIIHEIGHMYGVPDHYNGITHIGQADNCIWGKNKDTSTVATNLVMCPYCKNIWNNHATEYNH